MADNDNGAAEFSELNPEVELVRVKSWTISRVMVDNEGAEHVFVLPYRWPPETSVEDIGASAGGGCFRVQPRGKGGTFLKGVKPVLVMVDGPPREFVAPGSTPPVPGAVEAPSVPGDAPAHVGSDARPTGAISVPVANALPGMPAAILDLHALPAESRALIGALHSLNAFTWASVQARSDAEGAARGQVADIAIKSMEELGKATGAATSSTVAALLKELDAARARIAELETRNRDLLSDREADRVELATLRTRASYDAPPPAARPRGVLELVEAIVLESIRTIGLPIVAQNLGVDPEKLRQLSERAGPERGASTS